MTTSGNAQWGVVETIRSTKCQASVSGLTLEYGMGKTKVRGQSIDRRMGWCQSNDKRWSSFQMVEYRTMITTHQENVFQSVNGSEMMMVFGSGCITSRRVQFDCLVEDHLHAHLTKSRKHVDHKQTISLHLHRSFTAPVVAPKLHRLHLPRSIYPFPRPRSHSVPHFLLPAPATSSHHCGGVAVLTCLGHH